MAMYCGAKLGELPKFMMMVIFLKGVKQTKQYVSILR